jgi:transposase
MNLDPQSHQGLGSAGSLAVPHDDEITHKLFMLLEGEVDGLGAAAAAAKFGFSRQRYFQLRTAFLQRGASALQSDKRGPKKRSRRTDEAVRQIIRQRFLDPDASADVIAQKLRQSGLPISTRSVERVIAEFGLQKKTL